MPRSALRLHVCALAFLALACGRTQQPETPMATPSVTLARGDAAIGTPIDMTYRFVVSPNAPAFTEDDVVFVHFLDTDGELMWTDDHQPGGAGDHLFCGFRNARRAGVGCAAISPAMAAR